MSILAGQTTPVFRMAIDGEDVTKSIGKRLVSIEVTDVAGVKSDEAKIVLDNAGGGIALPRGESVFEVALGWSSSAPRAMGQYTVDGIKTQIKPRLLTVTGRAVDFNLAMKERKTRSWRGASVHSLVTSVADEYQLGVFVDPSFSNQSLVPVPYDQFDQVNQADFAMLTQIARDFDATFKVTGGRLIFARSGAAVSSGIAPIVISEAELIAASARISKRGAFGAVSAQFVDADTERRAKVVYGEGGPVHDMMETFPDEARALSAARGRFDAMQRGVGTVSFSVVGNPALVAEHPVVLKCQDPLLSQTWIVTRAVHKFGKGYITTIEAETPAQDGVS